MKSVIAAAALAGVAVAAPGDWEQWSSSTTTTSSKPVVPTSSSTTKASTWAEWETTTSKAPVVSTTTTKAADSWTAWTTSTSPKPVVPTSSATSKWSEWVVVTSSTGKPVVPTSSAPAVASSWSAWPVEDDKCKPTVTSTQVCVVSTPAVKTPVVVSSSSKPAVETETWAVWSSSSSKPAVKTSTTTESAKPTGWQNVARAATGGDWDAWSSTTSKAPVVSTTTSKAPVVSTTTKASTWAEWDTTTSKAPVVSTVTTSPVEHWSAWETPAAVTSCSYSTYTIYPSTCGAAASKTPDVATGTGKYVAPSSTAPNVAKFTGAANKEVAGMGALALAGIAMLL